MGFAPTLERGRPLLVSAQAKELPNPGSPAGSLSLPQGGRDLGRSVAAKVGRRLLAHVTDFDAALTLSGNVERLRSPFPPEEEPQMSAERLRLTGTGGTGVHPGERRRRSTTGDRGPATPCRRGRPCFAGRATTSGMARPVAVRWW